MTDPHNPPSVERMRGDAYVRQPGPLVASQGVLDLMREPRAEQLLQQAQAQDLQRAQHQQWLAQLQQGLDLLQRQG